MGQYRAHLPNGNENSCTVPSKQPWLDKIQVRPERSIPGLEKQPQEIMSTQRPAAGGPFDEWLKTPVFTPLSAAERQKAEDMRVKEAIIRYRQILHDAGIKDSTQQANVLAQMKAETNFNYERENLRRYTAKNLITLFGKSFPGGIKDARKVVKAGPEAVAERIYDKHPFLGNKEKGDGYKYRGVTLLQITGRYNIAKYGKMIDMEKELLANPDLANDPSVGDRLMIVYIKDRVKDLSSIKSVTKGIGPRGGKKELAERARDARQIKAVLDKLPAIKPEQTLPTRPERPPSSSPWHPPLLYPSSLTPRPERLNGYPLWFEPSAY